MITLVLFALSILNQTFAFTETTFNGNEIKCELKHLSNSFRFPTKSFGVRDAKASTKTLFMSTSTPFSSSTESSSMEVEISSSNESLEDKFQSLSTKELKTRLLDLLPKMTGKPEEIEEVVALVNSLESKYTPVLTLDFFNMAMAGEWQLLFSTNMLGKPSASLRLRELLQRVEPDGKVGKLTNIALWDQASDGVTFDTSGTMSIKNSYTIGNQGAARMEMEVLDHEINLSKGSKVPDMDDIPTLVGMIHNAMPSELFDLGGMGMDTTFLDGNLRIVRLTANFDLEEEGVEFSEEDFNKRKTLLKYEGVRNIFVRKDSIEIRPTQE